MECMEEQVTRPLKDRRLNFMIDKPTAVELERLSAVSGAPQSELIRRGMRCCWSVSAAGGQRERSYTASATHILADKAGD